jgi:hypothetical protein
MSIYDDGTGSANKKLPNLEQPPVYYEAGTSRVKMELPKSMKMLVYIVSGLCGLGTVANGIWAVICIDPLCIIGGVLFM